MATVLLSDIPSEDLSQVSLAKQTNRLSSNGSALYKYENLPTRTEDDHFIRVLDLWPSLYRDQSLKVTIRTARIDDDTDFARYEALSYCWGDSTPYDYVSCDESHLDIGQNLSIALRRLRRKDHVRTLWVDAICINQDDVDERNAQVLLMHRVYHKAKQVIIFLDEPVPPPKYWNVRAAFEMATKLAKVSETRLDLDLRGISMIRKRAITIGLGFPKVGNKRYIALRVLFTCSWFQRVWVVQEAACATRATIVCGKHQIPWDQFMKGTDFGLRSGLFESTHIRKIILPVHTEAPRGSLSAALQMYRLSTVESPSLDLFTILRRFHGSRATDPRDKVFALLGLASLDTMGTLRADLENLEIRPDYRTEVIDLFRGVARKILSTSSSLDLLSIPSSQDDWPSWIPDWSATSRQIEALSYTTGPAYHSSRDSKAHPEFEGDTLILKGYFVDRIAMVVDRNPAVFRRTRLYGVVAGDKARDFAQLLTLFTYCFAQMQAWEALSPSGPNETKTYITGEYFYDVYQALLAAARAQFESQWYGLSRRRKQGVKQHAALRSFYLRFHKTWLLGDASQFVLAAAFGFEGWGNFDAEILYSRTFARTERGYLALVPVEARVGDSITICQGGRVPLVIRLSEPEKMKLLGDCYVHGMMNGEVFSEEECHDIRIS